MLFVRCGEQFGNLAVRKRAGSAWLQTSQPLKLVLSSGDAAGLQQSSMIDSPTGTSWAARRTKIKFY